MIDCPHVVRQLDDGVECGRLNAATGHSCGRATDKCQYCLKHGLQDAPLSHPEWQKLLVGHLDSYLMTAGYRGNQHRDLVTAFSHMQSLKDHSEQRELIKRIFRWWSRIKEEDGGYPPEQLAEKLAALADHFGLTDALQEAIDEYTHAREALG